MKGRIPKPDEIKKLQGTFRNDRKRENVPESTRLISPGEPPDFFDADEKREFEFITRSLVRMNVLQDIDLNIVMAYCIEAASYFKIMKFLKENGNTYQSNGIDKPRPEVIIARNNLDRMLMIGAKLGFSPADRQRLTIENKIMPEDDPMAKYLP
ncbi:MAG: phage terminase small subunit P27 family [Saprospiraceae bacterium]|nr:phage terminase small subunit P27 family [Saprospiraceae bacterium]